MRPLELPVSIVNGDNRAINHKLYGIHRADDREVLVYMLFRLPRAALFNCRPQSHSVPEII